MSGILWNSKSTESTKSTENVISKSDDDYEELNKPLKDILEVAESNGDNEKVNDENKDENKDENNDENNDEKYTQTDEVKEKNKENKHTQTDDDLSFTVDNEKEIYVICVNENPIYYNPDSIESNKIMWGVTRVILDEIGVNPSYQIRICPVSKNKIEIYASYKFFIISYESLIHTVSCNKANLANLLN
jgi:hypothetical protein